MSRLIDKGTYRNKQPMEEVKNTLLRANYDLDLGLVPNQLTNPPTNNPEAPYFRPPTTASHHLMGPTWQTPDTPKKNDSASKRLKLKDYLHLNSIQKKSRTRTSTSNSILESDCSQKGEEKSVMRYSKMRVSNQSNIESTVGQQSKYLETFKVEINQQIEQQIRRLQDLASYINNDYRPGTIEKQEEKLLFCDIHSTLTKEAAMHDQLGEHILKIQQTDPQLSKRKSSKNKYFWQRNSRLLSSPAKVKEGLQLMSAAFSLFGAGQNKKQ